MLRIGCESIVSISAINSTTRDVIELPRKIKDDIANNIKLGVYENGIFEAYLGVEGITFIDIAFVNGIPFNGNYKQRNEFLQKNLKKQSQC